MGQINKYIVGSICREHVHILIIIMIIIKVITPYTIVLHNSTGRRSFSDSLDRDSVI